MNQLPPTDSPRPLRRPASERAAVIVAVALVLAACRAAPTVPSGSPSSPEATAVSSPTHDVHGTVVADGLVVVAGGAPFVSDPEGLLAPFGGPGGTIAAVTTGGGMVLVVDQDGVPWLSVDPASAHPFWRPIALPVSANPGRALIALAPTGDAVAIVDGDPQRPTFALRIANLRGVVGRTFTLDRGLNGPPSWIGPSAIALNVIRPDQRSGFTVLDLASGAATDVPSFGFSLSATSDGSVVAFDDAASGDVLVGARVDTDAGGIDRMARIPSPAGSGPDAVALSPDGTRLAILRRMGSAVAIDVLVLDGDVWRVVRSPTLPGDPLVSMAWLR